MHPIVLVYSQLDKFAENSFLLARTACARQEMLGWVVRLCWVARLNLVAQF